MFPERDLDFDSGIRRLPQHLDHAADRLSAAIGLYGQFGDDDLAGSRVACVLGRDEDGLADAPLGGLDEQEPAFTVQAPHHAVVDAFDHLDDRPFPAAAPVHARLAHHHAIAVEDFSHLVRAEVQVLALLGDHEAVAVGMTLDTSGDEIELGGDQDRALAIAQDLTVALHRAQTLHERVALLRIDRKALRELLVGERDAGFGERPQNELATRNRMLVARRFAFAMRVGCAHDAALFH